MSGFDSVFGATGRGLSSHDKRIRELEATVERLTAEADHHAIAYEILQLETSAKVEEMKLNLRKLRGEVERARRQRLGNVSVQDLPSMRPSEFAKQVGKARAAQLTVSVENGEESYVVGVHIVSGRVYLLEH